MPDLSTDEQFLHRALDLARQGIGLASPNPYVGAVIVDPRGRIAGTGVYTYEGVKHAEIRALEPRSTTRSRSMRPRGCTDLTHNALISWCDSAMRNTERVTHGPRPIWFEGPSWRGAAVRARY
jgi:pyrimidine deaminase RibD-like protein